MMSNKEEKQDGLPAKLQIENALMMTGSIISFLLLPVFIYNCSKNARTTRFVRPVAFRFINHLQGYSCASICHNALWQYGIPTHLQFIQYTIEDGNIGIDCTVFVPHTRAWEADILLRQWERQGLGYEVISGVHYKDGHSSLKYADKLYEPIGVYAKRHSVDMMIGMSIFNWILNTKEVKYHSDKKNKNEIKIDGIVKDDTTLSQSEPSTKSKQTNRKSKGTNANPKSKKAKLGKVYK